MILTCFPNKFTSVSLLIIRLLHNSMWIAVFISVFLLLFLLLSFFFNFCYFISKSRIFFHSAIVRLKQAIDAKVLEVVIKLNNCFWTIFGHYLYWCVSVETMDLYCGLKIFRKWNGRRNWKICRIQGRQSRLKTGAAERSEEKQNHVVSLTNSWGFKVIAI